MRLESDIIPLKERTPFIFLRYGCLDVQDGSFVFSDETKRVAIPVASFTAICLEPGTTITHGAISLAASCGTLILWVGEHGLKLYSAGYCNRKQSDFLLHQVEMYADPSKRFSVAYEMYLYRFDGDFPKKRTIEQLRGIEGARVKHFYAAMGSKYGIRWDGRLYDAADWKRANPINRAISSAKHVLYGFCEACIMTAGFSPAVGFIHTGKMLSFVYDIADLFAFSTVIPIAFSETSISTENIEARVRHKCRDLFFNNKFAETVIETTKKVILL